MLPSEFTDALAQIKEIAGSVDVKQSLPPASG
jgi:hypothetical protein